MSELEQLKKKARRAYKNYQDATSHLNCGNALSQYISPEASKWALAFNEAMDKIALIDSNAPKSRL